MEKVVVLFQRPSKTGKSKPQQVSDSELPLYIYNMDETGLKYRALHYKSLFPIIG